MPRLRIFVLLSETNWTAKSFSKVFSLCLYWPCTPVSTPVPRQARESKVHAKIRNPRRKRRGRKCKSASITAPPRNVDTPSLAAKSEENVSGNQESSESPCPPPVPPILPPALPDHQADGDTVPWKLFSTEVIEVLPGACQIPAATAHLHLLQILRMIDRLTKLLARPPGVCRKNIISGQKTWSSLALRTRSKTSNNKRN